MKNYRGNLDIEFFTGSGVTVVEYQPWQFGLFHPDLKDGKFVWYPERGTLMYSHDDGVHKSGYKVGHFFDSEAVYKEIMKKINEK